MALMRLFRSMYVVHLSGGQWVESVEAPRLKLQVERDGDFLSRGDEALAGLVSRSGRYLHILHCGNEINSTLL
jgi:hypothetical protein